MPTQNGACLLPYVLFQFLKEITMSKSNSGRKEEATAGAGRPELKQRPGRRAASRPALCYLAHLPRVGIALSELGPPTSTTIKKMPRRCPHGPVQWGPGFDSLHSHGS